MTTVSSECVDLYWATNKESHLDIWGISAIFVSERLNVLDILERL